MPLTAQASVAFPISFFERSGISLSFGFLGSPGIPDRFGPLMAFPRDISTMVDNMRITAGSKKSTGFETTILCANVPSAL